MKYLLSKSDWTKADLWQEKSKFIVGSNYILWNPLFALVLQITNRLFHFLICKSFFSGRLSNLTADIMPDEVKFIQFFFISLLYQARSM